MKVLKGEMIVEGKIIGEAQMPYHDEQSFFVALVNICDQLKVDVPVWTSLEDRKLERGGEVFIPEGKNSVLKIYNVL